MGGELGGNSLGSGVGVEWLCHRMGSVAPPLSHPPNYVSHFLDGKLAHV